MSYLLYLYLTGAVGGTIFSAATCKDSHFFNYGECVTIGAVVSVTWPVSIPTLMVMSR